MTAKALLLDYGGVLTSPVLESFRAFCEDEALDWDVFRAVLQSAAGAPDSPFALVETGAIDAVEFDRRLAALVGAGCGREVDSAGLKERMFARATPDEAMLGAVGAARAQGVRTGLVSNSWGGAGYPRDRFDELFDAVVISGEVGLRKPDPEIYLAAARLVGIAPVGCVFVDDFAVNVEGARAVGMAGIHHRGAGETIAELERLLEVNLSRNLPNSANAVDVEDTSV